MFACDDVDVSGSDAMVHCDAATVAAAAAAAARMTMTGDKSSDTMPQRACCPAGAQCSVWGCVVNETHTSVYVSGNQLMWANAVVQLLILLAGLIAFGAATAYYWLRRRHQTQRVQRSRQRHQVVNEVERSKSTATASTAPLLSRWAGAAATAGPALKQASQLDGQCCGCGAVADTVLLPCLHAVCCYTCSANASYCPFCKAASTGRMRLYPV